MPLIAPLLLALATTLPPAHTGPLLARGPGVPPSVCTAFQAQVGARQHLVTARHCLEQPRRRAWLPGLVGSAHDTGASQWDSLHPIDAQGWRPWDLQADVSIAPATPHPGALPAGPMPRMGAPVVAWGYPQGRGPVAADCVMAGVVVLEGPVPRIRPSLRCAGPLPARMQGMSGGPVMDGNGKVVGVLVSGTRAPEGGVLPGFEPLDRQWLPEGVSWHWLITDEHAPVHRLMAQVHRGRLVGYRVVSPKGIEWSWWGSPSPLAAHPMP